MAFSGTGKIWMNGKLVEWKDATIHVASHVVHYGSGVFEGARCYKTPRGSACFRLDAHMRRLFDSCRIYRMEPAADQATLTKAVFDTIRANEFKACYIRPIVYRGYNELGVNPFPCPVDVAILTREWGAYLGKDAQLIKMEAIAEGYSEGIALDTTGNLSEGSGQNLFLVRDNILYTPPLSAAVLPGITRDTVITLARDLGFTVQEQQLPREMLYISDEVFFVGTAAEITPIRTIDKIKIGTGRRGPIAEALQTAFFDMINGETPDRHGWLTYVYPGEPLQAAAAASAAKATR